MTGYCEECGRECLAIIEDDSFDHEFGTEKISKVESDCCEAPVFADEDLNYELSVAAVRNNEEI